MVSIIILFGVLLVTVLAIILILGHLSVGCGPNEIIVLSGIKTRLPDGSVAGYRIITRGRVYRVPLLEVVQRMDLSPIPIEVGLSGYVKEGYNVRLQGNAMVGIIKDTEKLYNAVERFLGRDAQEIGRVAAETIEGSLRGIIAYLTVDEITDDTQSIIRHAKDEIAVGLAKMGLRLDQLSIESVERD